MIIGLTGGIGSGKSIVAQYFRELGVTVIDADDIAHQLLISNPTVIAAIIQRFGPDFLKSDHTLDRARLRSLIFEFPKERLWLESLLHPLIKADILARASRSTSVYTVIEIPLLIESNFQDEVDRILVVDCSEDLQVARVLKRDAIPIAAIQAILKSQADRITRLRQADDVIENTSDHASLKVKVLALHHYYKELFN